jgi:hypothetical protein
MTRMIAMLTLAAMTVPAIAQSPASAAEPLLHTHTAFDLTVALPLQEAAPLFGPNGERAWAGEHWNPEFLYPRPGSDVEGAVFTIRHGGMQAAWVNTVFDIEGRHFQYVYFVPDLMVTVIDVRFTRSDPATGVHVEYARTALSPEGNEHVTVMTVGDKKAGPEWQRAIDAYLAGRAHSSPHQ